jgi:2-polyprenyl-3-methyl-5-hydroxy-6-metoxy-1,4-benzoquinol methylase
MKFQDVLRRPWRLVSHLFLDKSYQKYYSAKVWDSKYGQEHYNLDVPLEDGRYGALMALLQRYDRGGPILDAGCGDGLLELRYRPLSESRLVAVDYAEAAIDIAKRRNIPATEFRTADFASFQTGETFSVVVFNESLYYMENYLDVLTKLETVLKADGVFVISMFDTMVTSRIWKAVYKRYRTVQTVTVKDGGSRRSWTIAVVGSAKAGRGSQPSTNSPIPPAATESVLRESINKRKEG